VGSLKTEVRKTAAEIVVITGGEPLMYNLDALTEELQQAGLKTHIETSGAYPLSGSWDWILFVSQKIQSAFAGILSHANELKVVIFNKTDFDWAEQYASLVSPNCKLYLQPEWDKASQMTPLIIDYIKTNPKWELSLQIHKYINVP
jgi:organic radical activating enzyme